MTLVTFFYTALCSETPLCCQYSITHINHGLCFLCRAKVGLKGALGFDYTQKELVFQSHRRAKLFIAILNGTFEN